MANKIQLRRDTATNWSNANPVLSAGEVGVDLTNKKIKIGDGSTAWNSLEYWDDKEPNGFDGSYTSLTGKPSLFSGSYADLTNKPTIPTNTNQLTNGAGFITSADIPTIPEDVSDLTDTGNLLDNGGAVVERVVVFPEGEEDDVAGVLANDEGVLYLSTADWTDANDVTKEFNITNASEFAVSQTGGLYNVIDASEADFPELIALFNFTQNQNIYNSADWTIDAGEAFGGPKVCYDVVYNFELNVLTFLWTHEASDPTSIAVDYPATVTYTGTLPQPGIWKRFIAADSAGTQIQTNGGEIVIIAQETAADQGDGVIALVYSTADDSVTSFNSTLELGNRGINLDVAGNDLTLERDGLDFDSGYKLARSQGYQVGADSTNTVYIATNNRVQVIKLIIKAQEDSGTFQACEMMIVTDRGESPTVSYTVYGLVHTGEGPFATFSADWDATAVDEEVGGRIVVSATNLSSTDSIWVETMAIEMTQWD